MSGITIPAVRKLIQYVDINYPIVELGECKRRPKEGKGWQLLSASGK